MGPTRLLTILFFISGCAALIYQIMWQRMLFVVFGVDLVSVTIIIAVFMFGLGLGGLLGGYIADRWSSRLLVIYMLIEAGVAIFGYSSPTLIDLLGNRLFASNHYLTIVSSFILLAFPTILMGSTFPVLVTHVNQLYKNVGRSVGSLYFYNTLGAACGAYLSGFVLLYSMETTDAVKLAACLNLLIALTAWFMFRDNN